MIQVLQLRGLAGSLECPAIGRLLEHVVVAEDLVMSIERTQPNVLDGSHSSASVVAAW
jgi:hypothetical protein